MLEFVWIISSEKLASLGKRGISPSYIVPHGQMNGQEGFLRGSRLWFILRGNEDRCLATASIKMVEKFREGYNAEDYVLSCDTSASFRISATFDNATSYTTSDFRHLAIGIHRASQSATDNLRTCVSRAVQVKLAPASDAALRSVKIDNLPTKGKGRARAAIYLITQNFCLDEIWASGTGEKLGPFSNFASRLLSLHGHDAAQISDFLKKSDPLNLTVDAEINSADVTPKIAQYSSEKSVDLNFTEIDPHTIYAREFVPSDGYMRDLEIGLQKTEAAEKQHQDMLREISTYLQDLGISSYQSTSIDLMIRSNDHMQIFEIKSSNVSNIVAQATKGAFQLACYMNAMVGDFESLCATLILHKVEDPGLEKFVHDALDRLGVSYLTYDPEKKWPHKLDGLLN